MTHVKVGGSGGEVRGEGIVFDPPQAPATPKMISDGTPLGDMFARLGEILEDCAADVPKVGGNKSAGVRVRQAMLKLKEAAQEVRIHILEMQKGGA